jgi:hypothetical protein
LLFENDAEIHAILLRGGVADELKLSIPTVTLALDHVVRLGIAKEVTGKRRAHVFRYSRYLKILSEGTEPLQQ